MTQDTAPAEPASVLDNPHRRYNPLTDEWVLVSAGRTNRPWRGRREGPPPADLPVYDPTCYLCPRNTRANGETNPDYRDTFVFTNDFAALRPGGPPGAIDDGLFVAEAERGTCRVLCFSPRHNETLAVMDDEAVRRVVDLWADQTTELGATWRWVQVFENRGEAMGASNPHPHGQIWAGEALPGQGARENETQRRYQAEHGQRLLLDYAAREDDGPRVVESSPGWLVVVPFWAIWPFETLLIPRRPASRIADLDDAARDDLVTVLRRLLARYENLFETPFPYSMGWHQAPFRAAADDGANGGADKGADDHWQLHAHFYPPLLRAEQRKFMVGYELLSESQRDITPEEAASRLRDVDPVHYRLRAAQPGPNPEPIANPR